MLGCVSSPPWSVARGSQDGGSYNITYPKSLISFPILAETEHPLPGKVKVQLCTMKIFDKTVHPCCSVMLKLVIEAVTAAAVALSTGSEGDCCIEASAGEV